MKFPLYFFVFAFFSIRTDEEFVLNFLRGSKFSYEKAKRKIDMWHTVRTHCPEFFQGWDPLAPDIHSILEKGYMPCLPLQNYESI